MQSREICVVIATILLALTLLWIQRPRSRSDPSKPTIAVAFEASIIRGERLYVCPGANGDIQPDHVDIRFVRAWYKKRPEVMYPAQKTSAQNSIRRFVVIEADDKPV